MPASVPSMLKLGGNYFSHDEADPCMRILPSLLAMLLLLLAPVVVAIEVDDLFEVRVRVPDQSEAARKQGFAQAMEAILIKVTGQREWRDQQAVDRLREQAAKFVQRYRYERLAPQAGQQAGSPAFSLWVTMQASALRQVVRQSSLPFWGKQRPVVLLWLGVETPAQRRVIAADTEHQLRAALQEVAQERGLPFVLPLWDLADRERVAFVDLAGGFLESVRDAAARYRADALVVAHAKQRSGNSWLIRWSLAHAGNRYDWEQSGHELAYLVANGAHEVVDRLASQLALDVTDVTASGLIMTVTEVDSLQAWLAVADYLASLDVVQAYRLQRLAGTTATFWVDVPGGRARLEQVIGLTDTLTPAAATAASQAAGEALRYRWVQ